MSNSSINPSTVRAHFERFLRTNTKPIMFVALFAVIGVAMLTTTRAATGNDLVVTAVTMSPVSPAAGQAVTFSATVKNQGSTAVPASVVTGVGFAVDGTRVTWNETNTAGLAAGASVTLTANAGTTAATWAATTGPHTLIATADDTNAIPDEVDEGNNTKRVDFTVGNTGNLYISPVTSNVLVGNNIIVVVRLTPGTSVDGVQATVNFDTTKLQFVSADTTGTPFTTALTAPTLGTGTVSVASGLLGSTVSTDSLVMTMTFKALVGSGSSSLTVSGNATKTGAYTNPTTTAGTVNFSAPDTTAPTTAVSSPAAGSNLVGTVTVSATATDNVGVTKVELYVDGVLKGTDTTSSYSFSINSTTLTNGAHNFQTKAYDAAGNVGSSAVVSLNAKNLAEDINLDGNVDLLDFSLLATKYGQTGTTLGRADINGDGTVNLLDFSLLAGKYGQ
jgi:hypothetical protein